MIAFFSGNDSETLKSRLKIIKQDLDDKTLELKTLEKKTGKKIARTKYIMVPVSEEEHTKIKLLAVENKVIMGNIIRAIVYKNSKDSLELVNKDIKTN